MYNLLHCHFESALRALAAAKPESVTHVRAIYTSHEYRSATPSARLTLLWQKILSLSESDANFDEGTFRGIVRSFLTEMAASDIGHVDLRIGPSVGRWRWMRSAADGLSIFREELNRYDDLSMTFLAGVNMTKPRDQLDAIFNTLSGDAGLAECIAGLDINLFPGDVPKFNRYVPVVRQLQADGLKLNIHLGELFGNDISRYILSRVTPDRIGHGVLLLREKLLVDLIKDRGICLDMCPTSNTLLGVADWSLESPAQLALQLGIPVSINTDDPVLFGTDIDREFRMAGLSGAQRETVLADSRKYRYGPP